jgi:hypothetical protein
MFKIDCLVEEYSRLYGAASEYTILTFSPPLLPRSDVPHTPAAEEFLRKFTTKTPFIRKIRTE